MIEVMRYPVAERAAVNKCSLQSEMQAHLSCEVDSALPNLRFIRFAGTGESFTRHHAELADAGHELLVGVAPLLGLACGKGWHGAAGEQDRHQNGDRKVQLSSIGTSWTYFPGLLIVYVNLAAGNLPDPDGFVAGVTLPDRLRSPLSPKRRASLARWTARFEKSFEGEIYLDPCRIISGAIMRTVGFRPV